MINFFVYGTLKVGGYYAKFFDQYRIYVAEATIQGALYDLGNFPAVKLYNNLKYSDNLVYGEIHRYKNEDRILEDFDRIEGYTPGYSGNLYNRETTIATTVNYPEEVQVIVYEFNGKPKGIKIPSGYWEVK